MTMEFVPHAGPGGAHGQSVWDYCPQSVGIQDLDV